MWTLVGLLIVAGAAGWWYRASLLPGRQGGARPVAAGEPARGGDARVPVEAAAVKITDVPIFLSGLGTAQAFNTVLIRSRVDGELIEIAFQEGQMVKEGDLLARIDPRPYQAALDQALAKKKQDEATIVSTKQDLARTQKLANQSFAPIQQLDQRTASVEAQTALIAADQALIDTARTQLDYATIRAPLSGRLGLRLVDQGNIVRAGDQTGIVEIAQLQPISVLFTAPEGQLRDIIAAKSAGDVRVDALAPDGRTVLGEGKLALINNTVDSASGTVRMKATFPNDDSKMWPGLSINTRLLVKTLTGVVTVPDNAVMRGQNELFVFAIGDDDTADKRVVKVGPITDGIAVILEGLKDGDRVVTAGQSRVQSGTRVEVPNGQAGRPGQPRGPTQNRAADARSTTVR